MDEFDMFFEKILGGSFRKLYLCTKLKGKGDKIMSTAVLSNGTSYYIPQADLSFFTELAERMKWQIIDKMKKTGTSSTTKSWVDEFAGKWQDVRSTAQIIKDIHEARTSNSEVSL